MHPRKKRVKQPASCMILRVKPLLKRIKIMDSSSTNNHTRVSL